MTPEITRTPDEIIKRINSRKNGDMFGFEWYEYVSYLNFADAKIFLKDDAKAEDWEFEAPTRDVILKRMSEYAAFAWEKANGCRGISSGRSISHYIAWIWLLGDTEFADKIEDEYEHNYEFYGKDILVMICDKYGFDHASLDDGIRSNEEY